MHYDVVIIGAGMSGLAAGIRLAYFDLNVCILERHYAFGGLNSYYRLNGREYDVGLHAVTNYVPPGVRSAPLPKLLRQLRLHREDFALQPQRYSEIRFPNQTLKFTNDIEILTQEVLEAFPGDADGFVKLIDTIREYNDVDLDAPMLSTRTVLAEHVRSQELIEMLLCPLMYYGSPTPNDMDFTQFVTMFKSIFLQGFARPVGGVRTIIKTLVKKFRACGGVLRMRTGVERLNIANERVQSMCLESGEVITADTVLSSAGHHETMSLCSDVDRCPPTGEVGRISFVECLAVLDDLPTNLGLDATIIFFCETDQFHYAVPDDLVDQRSGVVCCPTNYEGETSPTTHSSSGEGMLRMTWLASHDRWEKLDEDEYQDAKRACRDAFLVDAERYIPQFSMHVIETDLFTPTTIRRFTGHINGAVYGSPDKLRDGRTRLKNLFICGTDQGFLGIIGAMLSGITIANLQVLSKS